MATTDNNQLGGPIAKFTPEIATLAQTLIVIKSVSAKQRPRRTS